MSHKWIISLVAAVLAGAVAYGVTRSTACGRSAQSVDRLQDISFLTRELDLSDAQVKAIKNLHTTLGAKLTDSCTRHCAARMRLGRAVADETNGMIHAEAALTAMCLAYEQSERDTLTHILAVRALLNNEQKRRFEEMISECLCRPCKRQGCACMPEAGKRQTGRPRWIIRSRKSGPDRCRSRKGVIEAKFDDPGSRWGGAGSDANALLPQAEVTQDALDHGWTVDQRNNAHLLLAFRTEERVGFPHLVDEFAPFLGRDATRRVFGKGVVENYLLLGGAIWSSSIRRMRRRWRYTGRGGFGSGRCARVGGLARRCAWRRSCWIGAVAIRFHRLGGQLVMDATGVGDPVFDDLRREFPDTEGYRITAQSKRELVQGLMMAVEQRRVTWPAASIPETGGRRQNERECFAQRRSGAEERLPNAECMLQTGLWEVLTAEMRRYEYAAGPSGQVTYSAPSGYHDDCVMALALAVWGCRAAGVEPGRMIRMPELARGWGRRGNGAVLGMV
jgi:hypothetical protein